MIEADWRVVKALPLPRRLRANSLGALFILGVGLTMVGVFAFVYPSAVCLIHGRVFSCGLNLLNAGLVYPFRGFSYLLLPVGIAVTLATVVYGGIRPAK